MHWLLTYELAEGYLERRAEHRSAHLALAWAAAERGDLLLAGPVADPLDSALLLFQGETAAAAEAFARADPYVTAGLIRHWRVRPWQTVVGEGAANPLR